MKATRARIKQGHVARGSNSHWSRTGRPKDEFPTLRAAKAHAKKLQAEDMAAGRLLTFPMAYKCELGGHFHTAARAHTPTGETT